MKTFNTEDKTDDIFKIIEKGILDSELLTVSTCARRNIKDKAFSEAFYRTCTPEFKEYQEKFHRIKELQKIISEELDLLLNYVQVLIKLNTRQKYENITNI